MVLLVAFWAVELTVGAALVVQPELGTASFAEPRYAVSRFGFVLLDLTTLINSALDRREYGTLMDSAPVTSLRRGAFLLTETLDRNLPIAGDRRDDAAEISRDGRSYVAATGTLARAGIAAQADGLER